MISSPTLDSIVGSLNMNSGIAGLGRPLRLPKLLAHLEDDLVWATEVVLIMTGVLMI